MHHKLIRDVVTAAHDRFKDSGKTIEASLDNWTGFKPGRRNGNTTRLVDHAIQLLFEGKVVICFDHHFSGDHRAPHQQFLKTILHRLHHDHNPELFYADRNALIIYIK